MLDSKIRSSKLQIKTRTSRSLNPRRNFLNEKMFQLVLHPKSSFENFNLTQKTSSGKKKDLRYCKTQALHYLPGNNIFYLKRGCTQNISGAPFVLNKNEKKSLKNIYNTNLRFNDPIYLTYKNKLHKNALKSFSVSKEDRNISADWHFKPKMSSFIPRKDEKTYQTFIKDFDSKSFIKKSFFNKDLSGALWFSSGYLSWSKFFSTRKYWWSRLPSALLIQRLTYKTLLIPFNFVSNKSSLFNLTDKSNKNNLPEWLMEKQIYWYWVLPFFGLLGLSVLSSNETFLRTDLSFLNQFQKSSELTDKFFLKTPTIFPQHVARCGPYNENSIKPFSTISSLKNQKKMASDLEISFENLISWETLHYLDSKRSLFDTSKKYIKNINYYHDTLSVTLDSRWFNQQKEEYNCTFSDLVINKKDNLTSLNMFIWETSLNMLKNTLLNTTSSLMSYKHLKISDEVTRNFIDLSRQVNDDTLLKNPSYLSNSNVSILKKESKDIGWNKLISSQSNLNWYWHTLKTEPLFNFLNTDNFLNSEQNWINMDEFAQKISPSYLFLNLKNQNIDKTSFRHSLTNNNAPLKKELVKNRSLPFNFLTTKKYSLTKKLSKHFSTTSSIFGPHLARCGIIMSSQKELAPSFLNFKKDVNLIKENKFETNIFKKLIGIYYPGKNNVMNCLENKRILTTPTSFLNLKKDVLFFKRSSLPSRYLINKVDKKNYDFVKNSNSIDQSGSLLNLKSLTESNNVNHGNLSLLKFFLSWNESLTNNFKIYKGIGREFMETDFNFLKISQNKIRELNGPINSFQKANVFYNNILNTLWLESNNDHLNSILISDQHNLNTFIKYNGVPKPQMGAFISSGYQFPEYDSYDLVKFKKIFKENSNNCSNFLTNKINKNNRDLSEAFFKINLKINIPPSALKFELKDFFNSEQRLIRPYNLNLKNFELLWCEIYNRINKKNSFIIKDALVRSNFNQQSFLGGSLLNLKNNKTFLNKEIKSFLIQKKNKNSLLNLLGPKLDAPPGLNKFNNQSCLTSKKKNKKEQNRLALKDNPITFFNLKKTYINNWSIFQKYFTNYYGTSKIFTNNLFKDGFLKETLKIRPEKWITKNLIKDFSFGQNLLLPQENIIFKKWHSKRKEGFFYKTINKMNFLSNKLVQKPTVELLWEQRANAKLKGFQALQTTKYYQGKTVRQNNNSLLIKDNENSNKTLNKIVRILLKRRRYRKVVSFDKLSHWLRDTLYFRKMSSQIKLSNNYFNRFSSRKNTLENFGQKLNLIEQGLIFKDFSIKNVPSGSMDISLKNIMMNKKLLKKTKTSSFRPFYESLSSLNFLIKNEELIQNPIRISNSKKRSLSFSYIKFLNSFAKQFKLSNSKIAMLQQVKKEKDNKVGKYQTFLKRNFSDLKMLNVKKLLPTNLNLNVNSYRRTSQLIDYKPIPLNSYMQSNNNNKNRFSFKNLKKVRINSFSKPKSKINSYICSALIPGNESYLSSSINYLNNKKDFINKSGTSASYQNSNLANTNLFLKQNSQNNFNIILSYLSFLKQITNFVNLNLNNTYIFLNGIFENITKFINITININPLRDKQSFKKSLVSIFPYDKTNSLYLNYCLKKKNVLLNLKQNPNLLKTRTDNEKYILLSFLQDLRKDSKWRNNIRLNWQTTINPSLTKDIQTTRLLENVPFKNKNDFIYKRRWNLVVQNEFTTPLFIQYKNLSSTLSIWRERFKISRDYKLLLNIYKDHLGASLNNIFKEFLLSNLSLTNDFLNSVRTDGPLTAYHLQNENKKNINNNFQAIKLDVSPNFWYRLSLSKEKSFVSPNWSFNILNHLKTNHPSVYQQILLKNKKINSNLKESSESLKNINNESLINEKLINDLLGNFTKTICTHQNPTTSSLMSSENATMNTYNSYVLNKNELMNGIASNNVFLINKLSSRKNIKDSLKNDSAVLSKNLILKPFLILMGTDKSKKLDLMKRQEKFLRILQMIKTKKIFNKLIDPLLNKNLTTSSKKNERTKRFSSNLINSRNESRVFLFLKKLQNKKSENWESGLENIDSTLKKSTSNEKSYTNGFKKNINKIKYRRKAGILSSRTKETDFIKSSLFLQNTGNSLLGTSFWMCAILFHLCIIFSLINIYKSAFHFCMKCTFTLTILVIKHFINLKRSFQRINKSIYQNSVKFIIDTINENLKVTFYKKILSKFKSYLISFLFVQSKPFTLNKRNLISGSKTGNLLLNFFLIKRDKNTLKTAQSNKPQWISNLITFFGLSSKTTSSLMSSKNATWSIISSSFIKTEKFVKNDLIFLNKNQKEIKTHFFFLNNKSIGSGFSPLFKNFPQVFSKSSNIKEEKNLFVFNFKLVKLDFFILLLIGESQVLAELEPYREMHWYFLKKQPLIMRAPSTKQDPINMYDYQADEKIRKLKIRLRKSAEILSGRMDKTNKKYKSISELKNTNLADNTRNQKSVLNINSFFKQKNEKDKRDSRLMIDAFKNNSYFDEVKPEKLKKILTKHKRLQNLQVWKSLFSFFGKTFLISRLIKLNQTFRQSFFFFDQPLSIFGPIGTIFGPYLVKQFAIPFDTNKNKPLLIDLFFKDKKISKKISFANFFDGVNKKVEKPSEKINSFKGLQFEGLNDYIGSLESIECLVKNGDWTKFLYFQIRNRLSTSKNLTKFSSIAPLSIKKEDRDMSNHLTKLVKKYSLIKQKFKNNSLSSNLNLFYNNNKVQPLRKNLSLEILKMQQTEKSDLFLNPDFSSIYEINTENSVSKMFLNSETYDPKTRFYRFFTNFDKKFKHVRGLSYDYDVHNQLGPLVCQIYSGMFLNNNKNLKNILLVGSHGRLDTSSLLVQAMAGETGFKLFMEDSKRLGRVGRRGINKSIQRLFKLFQIAQSNVPCIVYLEDIHVIASKRKLVLFQGEYDDEDLAMRSLFSKLISKKEHMTTSFRNQNLFFGGETPTRRRAVRPQNPIPNNLIRYQLNRRSAYSNYGSQNTMKKLNTTIFVSKKLAPSFTTNAVLIWKMFKNKIATPRKRVKEAPWTHLPIDALRSIHPLTYSVKVKVAKLSLLAIYTMGTRLRLVKDLIRLFESLKYDSYQGFVVFATTNKLSQIDPSLRQPGRLEETIYLSPSLFSSSLIGRIDVLNTYANNFIGFKNTFNIVNSALMLSSLAFSFKNQERKNNTENKGASSIIKGVDAEWNFVNSMAKKTYEKGYLSNYLEFRPQALLNIPDPLKKFIGKNFLADNLSVSSIQKEKNSVQKVLTLLNTSNQILSNISYRINSSVKFEQSKKETEKTSSKKKITNRSGYLKNFSNLSVIPTCAYGQAGKFILSFVFEQIENRFVTDKFENRIAVSAKSSPTKILLKNKVNGTVINTTSSLMSYKNDERKNVYDIQNIDGLNLWSFSLNTEFKQSNKFLQRSKYLKTQLARFIAPKIGELFFYNLPKKIGHSSPIVSLNSRKSPNFLKTGFINVQNLNAKGKTTSSFLLSLMLTNNFTGKNTFLPRLFRFEDVLKQRERGFSENLNSAILYEYLNLNLPSFLNKNTISLEENLQNQQQQKYLLNLEKRPLRKYNLLKTTSQSSNLNKGSLIDSAGNLNKSFSRNFFHMLFNELSSLDEISGRPTSLIYSSGSYFYNRKIMLKQKINKFSYKWWNWHLKNHFLNEEYQYLDYFPYADKHYNPRHRRWTLSNGYWGYWFTYEKVLSYDIYEQWMIESFHKLSNKLDNYREFMDFLAQLLIQKQVLTEVLFINVIKRFKL